MSAEHDPSTTAEGTEPEGEGGANLLFFVVLILWPTGLARRGR